MLGGAVSFSIDSAVGLTWLANNVIRKLLHF